ncbi:hydantoinase/oxoprolinase family protein [Bradyrhizobium sp. NP1]|uniref:hydantoinase/oxoprolinase family protein n=1 Tax=Bradyrhizobium sp. NP1 TaxID=3049772 RepID=UPI0025A57F58|nr:hydantoinase/oxoprolinase family protein [Bradyrhizobium sp. NP1]WJR80079.1 hydantoinase/oxoprolinase family protein [Bradyrhizobium sp. NP1]
MATSASAAGFRIAVDIGGTFTDIALLTDEGLIHQSKVSSTPSDPSVAVVEGVGQLLAELAIAPSAVREVLHGTTVGSNTILQRKGARTGLITTRGFRDVLEIGRIRMPDMFDLTWDKPKPLVPRRHRLEVIERMAADGEVIEPLSEDSVIAAGEALVAAGIEAVAIAFINSYRNPAHELEAESILRKKFSQLLVTTSCAVLPEMKEYERTSTTVVNAYLLSAMRSYLQRLESGLRGIGVHAPILVMTSNGGMLAAGVTCDKPVLVVASGPAGGVIGAARLGVARDDSDVIVFDMGGTTAKAVIIEDGRPTMTSEYEFRDGISTSSRFIKAGGYMLKVPAIDIAEVGAGGGSLAGIDKGGLLVVGPESAGAAPGPACYGLGNERPTVTDANVVLGFINDSALAGGKLAIDRGLSEKAIRHHVGDPLGLPLSDAAHGIRAVANAAMARAVRAVTVERGRDPRDLTLMAFGGNGGVHAPDLARLLGIPRVVVPPMSGIFSAIGMLASDIEHTALKVVSRRLDRMSAADLKAIKAGLQREVAARLADDGYRAGRTAFLWEADLRHEGQATELTVPFEGDDLDDIRERFVAEYLKTYGYRDTTPIELMKLRVAGRGLRDNRLDFGAIKIADRASATRAATRRISFARGEPAVEVEVVGRNAVGSAARPGPLIIDEFDATVVVPPDARVHRDAIGCIVLEFDA